MAKKNSAKCTDCGKYYSLKYIFLLTHQANQAKPRNICVKCAERYV